mgnify:CR=1 FL=1
MGKRLDDGDVTVLHLIWGLGLGGAERVLCHLVEGGRGSHKHAVVSVREGGHHASRIRELGASLFELGSGGWSDLPWVVTQVRRIIDDVKPDVVHCWMYHACVIGAIAVPKGTPQVWAFHNTPLLPLKAVPRLEVGMLRRLQSRAYCTVVVSDASRNAHAAMGFDESRLVVIPNGVPSRTLEVGARRPSLLHTFVSVGRFHPVKNHIGLVQAFALARNRLEGCRLYMVGPGLDPCNTELVSWLKSWGVQDAVYLLGQTRNPSQWLSAAHTFVSTSVSESLPMSLLEAISCGCVPVVTDVGDCAAVVRDERLVSKSLAPEEIAGRMVTAARLSTIERAKIVESLRERVKAEYSLVSMIEAYSRVYGLRNI